MNVIDKESLTKVSGGTGASFADLEAMSGGRVVFIKSDHTERQRKALIALNKARQSGFFMDTMSGIKTSFPPMVIAVDSP